MEKNLILIAAALVASPALAQDYNGPYVGASIGYAGGKSRVASALSGAWTSEAQSLRDHVTGFTSARLSPDGVSYGVQAGYNAKLGSNFVLGAEAEVDFFDADETRVNASAPYPVAPSVSYASSNGVDPKRMIALKAKLGVTTGKTLFYAHGGWAWMRSGYSSSLSSNGNYRKAFNGRANTDGYRLGAGVEHKLGRSVGLRLEYAYTRQDNVTFSNAYLPGSAFTTPAYNETYRQGLKLHQVKAGLNVHF